MDFSHPFDFNMPVPDWPGVERQEFALKTFKVDLNGLWQNYLSFNLHSGTHIDSPSMNSLPTGITSRLKNLEISSRDPSGSMEV